MVLLRTGGDTDQRQEAASGRQPRRPPTAGPIESTRLLRVANAGADGRRYGAAQGRRRHSSGSPGEAMALARSSTPPRRESEGEEGKAGALAGSVEKRRGRERRSVEKR